AALHLPLDVARVDRLAGVLHDREAQDLDLAGLGVDVEVDEVGRERAAPAGRVDVRATGHGAAGRHELLGDLLEVHALAVGREGRLVRVVRDLGRLGLPARRGRLLRRGVRALGGAYRGQAGREGRPAAAGHVGESDRVGVGDDRPDLLGLDAEYLGGLHGGRGARAADVGRALDQRDG